MGLKKARPGLAPVNVSRAARPAKTADPFYQSAEWKSLKASVIAERGRRCERCGKTQEDDGSPVLLHGDHRIEIKDGGAPLDRRNVQLLCVRSGGNGAGGVGGCHNRKTAEERERRLSRR